MDKKMGPAVLIALKAKNKGEDEEKEYDEGMYEDLASEMMAAAKKGDAKEFAASLKTFVEACVE